MRSGLTILGCALALALQGSAGLCLPVVPSVTDGGQYSSDASTLSATFSAEPSGCPVEEYLYAVGTSPTDPGSGYLVDWTSAGEQTSVTLTNLTLTHNTTYYWYVKARDCDTEWTAAGSSDGIKIDLTPPAPPVVTDSGQFTTAPSTSTASWMASDDESPVVEYQYALGTSPTDGGGLQQLFPSYYACGNSITHSSPQPGIGWTGDWGMEASAADKDYLHRIVQRLQAASPSNATTVHYSHEGGRASGKITDLLNNVSIYKSFHPDLITIQTGENDLYITPAQFKAYYEQLVDQLLNNTPVPTIVCFGLWSSRSTYDPTTREYQLDQGIREVCQSRGLHFASLNYVGSHPFTSNPGQTLLKWHPNDEGMRGYADVFFESLGAYLVPWKSAGASTGATEAGLSVQDGQGVYWYVRAKNAAGLWSSTAMSDGVMTDTSGPWDASITDDGTGAFTPGQLHATWVSFDSVSPIVEYQYAIGRYFTINPTVFVLNWKSTASTDVTEAGLPLQDGFYYYWYVKARNSLGLWSAIAVSDGLRYDGSPPTTPAVTDDGAYTTSASSLHASWTSSEPHTTISEYRYAIGTSSSDPGSGYTVGWTSTGTTASATASGLTLTSGTRYYFYVKAVNSSGGWSAAGASDGITVDTSAPPAPVVTDSGASTTNASQLTASWTCSDAQSGITAYQYAIGTTPSDPGSGYIVSWTQNGTSTSAIATGLSLTTGKTYYWYVKATNGAGLLSPVGASNGIVLSVAVSTPGAAKLLPDGANVTLSGAVIVAAQGALLGRLYVCDPKRSSGIGVASNSLVFEGDIVTVTGTMATSGKERVINSAQVQVTSHQSALQPIQISPTQLLAEPFFYTPGTGAGQAGIDSPNSINLSTTGLLARIVGRISQIDSSYAYVFDGTWAMSTGIRVSMMHLSGIAVGDMVRVSGIVCLETIGGQKTPVLKPRRPSDLQILAAP